MRSFYLFEVAINKSRHEKLGLRFWLLFYFSLKKFSYFISIQDFIKEYRKLSIAIISDMFTRPYGLTNIFIKIKKCKNIFLRSMRKAIFCGGYTYKTTSCLSIVLIWAYSVCFELKISKK